MKKTYHGPHLVEHPDKPKSDYSMEGFSPNLESGSPDSHGIAGARGPLMSASGWTDPRQVVVCTTPDDGLNTFQGRLTGILSRWSGDGVGECTLMASFDFQTFRRLNESLSGPLGNLDMDGALCSLTIVREGPRTT